MLLELGTKVAAPIKGSAVLENLVGSLIVHPQRDRTEGDQHGGDEKSKIGAQAKYQHLLRPVLNGELVVMLLRFGAHALQHIGETFHIEDPEEPAMAIHHAGLTGVG
jgi:hypothetical protein